LQIIVVSDAVTSSRYLIRTWVQINFAASQESSINTCWPRQGTMDIFVLDSAPSRACVVPVTLGTRVGNLNVWIHLAGTV